MNNELLLLFKEHIDTLIEQTGSLPHETLEFKIESQFFSPTLDLDEKKKLVISYNFF